MEIEREMQQIPFQSAIETDELQCTLTDVGLNSSPLAHCASEELSWDIMDQRSLGAAPADSQTDRQTEAASSPVPADAACLPAMELDSMMEQHSPDAAPTDRQMEAASGAVSAAADVACLPALEPDVMHSTHQKTDQTASGIIHVSATGYESCSPALDQAQNTAEMSQVSATADARCLPALNQAQKEIALGHVSTTVDARCVPALDSSQLNAAAARQPQADSSARSPYEPQQNDQEGSADGEAVEPIEHCPQIDRRPSTDRSIDPGPSAALGPMPPQRQGPRLGRTAADAARHSREGEDRESAQEGGFGGDTEGEP